MDRILPTICGKILVAVICLNIYMELLYSFCLEFFLEELILPLESSTNYLSLLLQDGHDWIANF